MQLLIAGGPVPSRDRLGFPVFFRFSSSEPFLFALAHWLLIVDRVWLISQGRLFFGVW